MLFNVYYDNLTNTQCGQIGCKLWKGAKVL